MILSSFKIEWHSKIFFLNDAILIFLEILFEIKMTIFKLIFLSIINSKINVFFIIIIIIKPLSTVALPLPLPFNEYSYILARNNLEFIDQQNLFHKEHLSSREKILDIYFQKLKADEFRALNSSSSDTSKHFYPSRPIETELEQIQGSNLYQQLKLLPKGKIKRRL